MADLGYLARMIISCDDGGDSTLEEELEGEGSEAPISTPTMVPPSATNIPPPAPGAIGCEWGNAETQYMLDMIREYILDSGKQSFWAKDWDRMRGRLVVQFPLESTRKGVHIKSKWNKMRKEYFRQKKEYNMSGDNSGVARWNWYNAMDGMLSETAKVNGVPGANDQGAPVAGTEGVPVDAGNDDGCGVAPAAAVRAANLPGIRGAPIKRRRIKGDMACALDRFAESFACIERMKMETAIQLHTDNKKLEMDILQSQQATTKHVAALFVDVIRSVNRGQRIGKGHAEE
jgi:hypothetical protein